MQRCLFSQAHQLPSILRNGEEADGWLEVEWRHHARRIALARCLRRLAVLVAMVRNVSGCGDLRTSFSGRQVVLPSRHYLMNVESPALPLILIHLECSPCMAKSVMVVYILEVS